MPKYPNNVKQIEGKAPLDLLFDFPYALDDISRVRSYGNLKYEDTESYKQIEYRDLVAAALRHISKFLRGEVYDDESSQQHLSHAVLDLMMVIDQIEELETVSNESDNNHDDKYYAMQYAMEMLKKDGFKLTDAYNL